MAVSLAGFLRTFFAAKAPRSPMTEEILVTTVWNLVESRIIMVVRPRGRRRIRSNP
jgi:hypothetical protein